MGTIVKKLFRNLRVPIGGVVIFCGCFSYRPAELATLPEGGQVRVNLTRQGFASLPETSDLTRPRIAGTLVSRDADQVRVRVPLAVEGATNNHLGQEYVIPTRDVLVFERRELSRTRTTLAVAGGLATAAAIYLTFEKGNPFSRDNPDDQKDEEPGFRRGFRRLLGFSISVW